MYVTLFSTAERDNYTPCIGDCLNDYQQVALLAQRVGQHGGEWRACVERCAMFC